MHKPSAKKVTPRKAMAMGLKSPVGKKAKMPKAGRKK
jgi:hypothetical protein